MMNSLFIGSVGMPEVLLIVLVVLLLFGGKKIPELMSRNWQGHTFFQRRNERGGERNYFRREKRVVWNNSVSLRIRVFGNTWTCCGPRW